MIKKTPYEEFFRYHDFTPWLNETETIASVSVKAYYDTLEQAGMISDAAPYDGKKVIYVLKGGTPSRKYKIVIQIVSSNGQKFEDRIDVVVI